MYHDVALVKLKDMVQNIQPAKIYPSHFTYQNLEALGWGRINKMNGPMSLELMMAKMKPLDHRSCELIYRPFIGPRKLLPNGITRDLFCAVGKLENMDTCDGDSGGPVQAKIGNQIFVIGITSFGPKICGNPYFPGVYTRLSGYRKWIKRVVG